MPAARCARTLFNAMQTHRIPMKRQPILLMWIAASGPVHAGDTHADLWSGWKAGFMKIIARLFAAGIALAAVLPSIAAAAPSTKPTELTGVLTDGGGIDDLSIVVRTESGRRIDVYCVQMCGADWFVENGGAMKLKKALVGRRVSLRYATEINNDRVAGPGRDEEIDVVKRVRLLR